MRKSQKKKRIVDGLEDESDLENSDLTMSSESSEDLSSEDESEVEPKKKSGKKRRDIAKDESSKESKSEEKPVTKSDHNVQLNIEDLMERFKHLELKLGKRSNREFPLQRPRSSLYCIMCRKSGHLV